MKTHRANRFRPIVDGLETRCLLSQAVVEIQNKSTYNISFDFRWTPSSAWSAVTEAPGQGELFWTGSSGSLTPQALYNTTTSPGSQTTVNLAQGYGQWNGTGTPPASAAQFYQFQNTSTGVLLYYAPPRPPAAPSFTASAASATQVNLTWSSVAGASGYFVDEWIGGAWAQIGSLGSGSTGVTINGLSPGTTYDFVVGAFNSAGTTWANYVGVTTLQKSSVGVNEPTAAVAYQPVNGALFGAGGPSYLDVQQGAAGDCWLLASLAEVAARDPSDIRNMFTYDGTTVESGSVVGLYTVRFFNKAGAPEYVTVDTELPAAGTYYDRVASGVLWVALAEKAYAEANGAGSVTTSSVGSDSYNALNDGDPAWALQAITGKSASDYSVNPTNIASAWNAGELIVLTTSNPSSPYIVGSHCYAVVAYNASSSQPFQAYNPWGTTSSGWAQGTYEGHQVYGLFTANAAFVSQNFAGQCFGIGTANEPDDQGSSVQEGAASASSGSTVSITARSTTAVETAKPPVAQNPQVIMLATKLNTVGLPSPPAVVILGAMVPSGLGRRPSVPGPTVWAGTARVCDVRLPVRRGQATTNVERFG